MKKTVYNRNATMKMIGRQTVSNLTIDHDIFGKICDILQAHDDQAREDNRICDYIEPAIDFVILGMIYGKRAERERRRKRRERREQATA